MTTMKLLEDRISELEKKILGFEKQDNNSIPCENSVVDNLLNVHTLISSALSGREKLNEAIKRLPELNGYINMDYEDTELSLDAKAQHILAMESEIRNTHNSLCKVQELSPVLDTKGIQNLPQLNKKLDQLSLTYLNAYENSQSLSTDVLNTITQYNAIINNISKTLISLDAMITAAEISTQPRKQID